MGTTTKHIFKILLLAAVVAAVVPFAAAMDQPANNKLMAQSKAAATARQHEAAASAFTKHAGQLEAAAKTQERIANIRRGRLYQRIRPAKFVDSSSKNHEIADRLRSQSQQSLLMAVNHLRQADKLKLVD